MVIVQSFFSFSSFQLMNDKNIDSSSILKRQMTALQRVLIRNQIILCVDVDAIVIVIVIVIGVNRSLFWH